MENEELDNELVVSDDVPETSEQNLEEVNIGTSEDGEQVQETTEEVVTPSQEEIERMIEERANKRTQEQIEQRLIRDRINRERKQNQDMAKYRQLESIMKAGLGVETLDEAINKSSEFYKGQGVNIPIYKEESSLSERDEKILAEADAREIISFGKQEMETEANRIASIPENKRTLREKTVFNALCKELINLRDVDTLKSKGYEIDLLNEKKFIEFRNQFNVNTPIETIVGMYKQVNNLNVEQPKSPGSAKSSTGIKQIKDYYSPEDFDKLTEEDLRNPKIMEIVDRSRLQWFKNRN